VTRRAPGPPPWAVITGGGTGGHVYPALAVARALVGRGHSAERIQFLGARRGLEATKVPEAGFAVTVLPGRGIQRRFSRDNVGAVAGLLAAIAEAVVLLRRWRPAVVISVGGYASVAGVLAAAVWRIPVVVVNLDAVPGMANRLAGRVAAACAVAFADTPLPRAELTGVPVRPEMESVDRSPHALRAAKERLGLPADARVVVVSGGSLGARRLNQAVLRLAEDWQDRSDVAIRHVIGDRDWAELGEREVPAGPLTYQRVRYEPDMASLYAAADVAVQRAGASTVAELCAAGVPSILVPLPNSPGDHQGANGRALAAAGAAVVIPDAELTAHRLARELDGLDPAQLAQMGGAAKGLARPHAADAVAALAERCARD
jgi:UDP-N-acetylglucosamine--N-acetylmuramyl-(pentapeptide) pyrophosphoryl-undecaprenol N-acetylglucosamine transferase